MIFSKSNPPDGYYVYLYLREDGTPYYCGKGKGRRAWAKDHTVAPPVDPTRIVFPAWGLLELWAFGLERKFRRWYGRIDLGTGIVHNRTDGGDGFPNRIVSPATVAKALATKRKTGGVYACATPEARRKRKETILKKNNGKYHTEEAMTNILTKRLETRKKQGNLAILQHTWIVTDPNGNNFIVENLWDFCENNNIQADILYFNKGRVVKPNTKHKRINTINTVGWMINKVNDA